MKAILASAIVALLALFGVHLGTHPVPSIPPVSTSVQQTASAAETLPPDVSESASSSALADQNPATTTPPSIVNNYITQPVVERIVASSTSSITGTQLAAALLALKTDLLSHLPAETTSPPQQVAAGGSGNPIALSNKIDNLVNTAISNPTITGGSITAASITGTISNTIDTALGAITSLGGTDLTYTRATFTNATTTNLYATNASIVTASTTNLTVSATSTLGGVRLTNANCSLYGNGGKLTTDAFGNVICADDYGSSGGAGSPGGANTQVQFNDSGSFGGNAGFTYNKTGNRITVTNASTTNLTSSYASSTNLFAGTLALSTPLPASSGGTGIANPSAAGLVVGNYAGTGWQQLATSSLGLLTTNVAEGSNLYFTNNRVASVIAGTTTDALAQGSTNKYFSNTLVQTYLDTLNKGYYFATSSAAYWQSQNNFFSTTSAQYFLGQNLPLAFSTSSASYFLSQNQSGAFATTSSDYWLSQRSTSNLAEGSNLYFINARADARINATSTIGTLTSAPNLGTIATSLTGFVKATAGALSTAAVNLASDVTGILPVGNGGTGWANLASGTVLLGNGSGAVSTTTRGSLTETGSSVLTITGGTNALLGGGATIQVTQSSASTNGFLSSADWTTFNNKVSNTRTIAAGTGLSGGGDLSADRALSLNLANANNWTGLQTFANASTSIFSSYGPAYFGATATSSFASNGALTLAQALSISSGGTGATTATGATNNLQFLASGSGAAVRALSNKLADTINIKDFGAVCDSVTDDTAAIANAIAATPAGGTLVLPAGPCLVSGSGSTILTITTPINIVGQGSTNEGAGSNIVVKSSVPTTRDIFHIIGVTNESLGGYTFRNFNVVSQTGGGVGRHIFHFDTTAGTLTQLSNVIVDNVFMDSNASTGGYSIYLDNGSGTDVNGGVYTFTVSNSYLGGGLTSSNTGDSIRVINNLIYTANAGVTLNQIAGAGNFLMTGNNVVGTAGGIVITHALAPIIENNEFEQQVTNTEANNSIIDITGSAGLVQNAKIFSNQIQSNASVGNPTPLRIASADGTYISSNRLGTPSTYNPVIVTSAASATIFGPGNGWYAAGVNQGTLSTTNGVSDSGTGTQYSAMLTSGVLSLASNGLTVGSNQLVLTGGNIGIGTTGPTAPLTVMNPSGGIQPFWFWNHDFVNGSTGTAFYGAFGTASGNTYFGLQTVGGGNTLNDNLVLEPTGGNVGIGTTSPDMLLSVGSAASVGSVAHFENSTGSCYINPTTTSLSCSSDVRLKTNINTLTASSGVEAVLQLDPVSFNWKGESAASSPHTGFIAQQVQPILPDLVSQGPDGFYTLNYAGFTPYLVKAVQEIASISGVFEQNLIAWLGSASNGIDDLFAQHLYAVNGSITTLNASSTVSDTVTANAKLCVGSICVTPVQFQAMVAAANAAQESSGSSGGSSPATAATPSDSTSTPDSTSSPQAPVIQINGENPAIINVGDSYSDLGATITGPQADLNLGIKTFMNGALTSNITIDTSAAVTDTIDYVATDQNGLSSTSTRRVIIEAIPSIVPKDDASTTATTVATPTATATSQ